MAEIVIPYEPREQQEEIHHAIEQHRFTVVVAHRRMGKTVSAIELAGIIARPFQRLKMAVTMC